MYKKFLMLFLAFMITGAIFMSCSSDDDGGTTPTPDPKLSITSPNGGEVLQMGEVVWIHFEDDLTEDVALYLYKNGDSLDVMNPLVTVSDSVQWAIPTNLDVDTKYQIKIVSTEDPAIFDMSDANFTIAPVGNYIIVTSSNGGDIWLKGSTHVITWYDNIAENVRIDLLKNGALEEIIYNEVASSGSQGWTIPETLDAGADYSIEITGIATAVQDQSNNFFCIADPLFEGNIVGDWNVTFSKQSDQFYFNADGTISATDGLGAALGEGTWAMIGNGIRIDDSETDDYLIGIVEGNEMEGTAGTDIWEAERVIPELLTPNGGQVWMHGTTQTITWDTAIAGNVVLSLADTTGIVLENFATVLGEDGTYDWTVPTSIEPGAAYLIRVAKAINGDAMDESDNYICISNTDVIDITGDWEIYSTVTKWTAIWTFNSDGTWTNDEPFSGTWELTGNGLRWDYDFSSTYYIGNVGIDVMTGTSMMATVGWNGERLLDVTYPNGGELLEMGSQYTITWDDNLTADYVMIELFNGDDFERIISSSTINSGDFNWTISEDLNSGAMYNIVIRSTTSDIYDFSDAYFDITDAPAFFNEDFDEALTDYWINVDGNWSVQDTTYQVISDNYQVSTSYYAKDYDESYSLESKVRKTVGSEYNFGIVFNGDDTTLSSVGDWNDCGMLLITAAGTYQFVISNSGSWNGTGWNTSAEIVQGLGEWNILRVDVNNTTGDYDVYINDVYIITVNNTSFNHGKIGLKMYDGTTAGTCEWDYVNVAPLVKKNIDRKYVELKSGLSANQK
ncbi:MAG: hypothetical protein GQ534_01325 [Candidatus Delongbacteria bacterium]|nr:hypothetical protein [Candidatus Delongbacteria bacterium]